MKGEKSREKVMREEITSTSFPVIAISDADRLLNDSEYRQRCAIRLVEIVIDELFKLFGSDTAPCPLLSTNTSNAVTESCFVTGFSSPKEEPPTPRSLGGDKKHSNSPKGEGE
ncbi:MULTISPECIES: hypothetical protein [unclassified Microcoleus]|uniref:hypothetical protein n=1 Tax=unclassified Microcoleus TaxID=2642155 RepID=UPI002FD5F25E